MHQNRQSSMSDKIVAKVKSQNPKSPDEYTVIRKGDGSFTCNCPHYLFRLRHSKSNCKHIKLVKQLGKGFINNLPDGVYPTLTFEEYET